MRKCDSGTWMMGIRRNLPCKPTARDPTVAIAGPAMNLRIIATMLGPMPQAITFLCIAMKMPAEAHILFISLEWNEHKHGNEDPWGLLVTQKTTPGLGREITDSKHGSAGPSS